LRQLTGDALRRSFSAALTGRHASVRFSFDMRASDVGALKELLQRVKKSGGGANGANGEAAAPWRVDEQVCAINQKNYPVGFSSHH
jgi:hypothetical protein